MLVVVHKCDKRNENM